MPGRRIEILPRTTYTFTAMTANQTLAPIFVALQVPVLEYREVLLEIRLHDMVGPLNATADFSLFSELPSEEDPGRSFRTAALAGVVTIAWNTPAPSLLVFPGSLANFGAMLSMSMTPKTLAQTGNFSFTVSAALSVKS